jgi:pimeloyl-ACP methyl ester carboxylesterase
MGLSVQWSYTFKTDIRNPTGVFEMKYEFPMRGETKELTPEVRAGLAGEFVQLPDGVVHYELGGPEDGPVVALVHGFSVPYFIWDPTFEALVQAGYRVLRYDLFGRGYSDRPHLRNDKELFNRQLTDLLDVLGIKKCLGVIGLSMGGVISANFCVQNPDRVEKLILIDPAGFPVEIPGAYKLLLVPGLGEMVFGLMDGERLEKAMADDFYDPRYVKAFADLYRPAMQFKGFRRSLISTIRAGVVDDEVDVYRNLGKMNGPPVMLVWGENDESVPFKFSKTLVSLVPRTQFHPIPNAGHIPHYEQASQVNPLILEFLDEH